MSENNNYDLSNEKAFNTECPICFSQEEHMILLSCLHRFHEACLENHTDLKCPKCRQDVINWSSSLREKIMKNNVSFKTELIEEDRRNILSQQRQNANPILYISPPPQYEVIAALQFLKDRGVPLRYLCGQVKVAVQKNGPNIPGQIYSSVIASIMDEMREDLANGNLEVEEELNEEELNENPFDEENEKLGEFSISVNFVDLD